VDLDDLLRNYFGTGDLDRLDPATLADGVERVRIAFAVERDGGRRFALWTLLHALGDAPDPVTFKNPRERRAAEDYTRAAARMDE
jgi:hypothetical protein